MLVEKSAECVKRGEECTRMQSEFMRICKMDSDIRATQDAYRRSLSESLEKSGNEFRGDLQKQLSIVGRTMFRWTRVVQALAVLFVCGIAYYGRLINRQLSRQRRVGVLLDGLEESMRLSVESLRVLREISHDGKLTENRCAELEHLASTADQNLDRILALDAAEKLGIKVKRNE